MAKGGRLLDVNFEIFGRVQGVFFRRDTQREAKKLHLVGWVMNTTHGTVKGQVQGPEDKIKDMKHWLQKVGSKQSRIDKAEFKEEVIDTFSAVNKLLTRESSIKTRQNVLLLTAHPDDECMFFTPTILSLLNAGHNVHLVCLSKGDFYGQGEIRKKELMASCSVLGIPISKVTIVDDERFKDGPDNVWDKDSVGERILGALQRLNIETLITFDKGGVSGHPNHIALHSAVSKLKQSSKLDNVTVFTLEQTSLIRKYTAFLDIPFSSIMCLTTFLNSPKEVLIGWKAMMMHQSQLEWFRWLYIVFSRYMYVNTLVEMKW